MDKSLANYIKDSSEKTTKEYFNANVELGMIQVEEKMYMNKDVIISMHFKDDVEAVALVGLEESDAIYLAKKVMEIQGFEIENSWDELSQSAILEYVNEVMGYATELLSDDGIVADITIPKFVDKKVYQKIERYHKNFEVYVEKAGKKIEIQYKICLI